MNAGTSCSNASRALSFAQALRRWAGVDRAVAYMAAGRAWSLAIGAVTLVLIGTFFSEAEQGYYYTFANVLGLQVFIEMGFNQCVIQFASHENARLRFAPRGQFDGEATAKARLVALGRLSLQWYGAMAIFLLAGVGGCGHLFFAWRAAPPEAAVVSWAGAWWALCLVTAANLLTQPFWFLLEGCNQVAFVYGYRTLVLVAAGATTCVAILGGAGLYAGAYTALAGFVISLGLLACYRPRFVRQFLRPGAFSVLALLRELWPFQWRMALSAISGYLIFSLLTPAVFHLRGAESAGKMGMSWQLVNALAALSIGWLSTKAPRYGVLISQRRYAELDQLAWRTVAQAVVICLGGGLALLVALAWLKAHFALGARFLDIPSMALLLAASVANQVILGEAYYLRAHKQEPFMALSVINGVVTAGGVFAATWYAGAFGACLAYATVQWSILPFATRLFLRKRREWHGDGFPGPVLASPA